MVARRVVVQGKVQGVFFRDSTRQRAEEQGVVGWVRNTPEGAVEAHLEGDEACVAEVERWMRAGGSPSAVVDHVEAEDVEPEGHESFVVR